MNIECHQRSCPFNTYALLVSNVSSSLPSDNSRSTLDRCWTENSRTILPITDGQCLMYTLLRISSVPCRSLCTLILPLRRNALTFKAPVSRMPGMMRRCIEHNALRGRRLTHRDPKYNRTWRTRQTRWPAEWNIRLVATGSRGDL